MSETVLQLKAIPGVRLGTASAGIKKPGRRDITLIEVCDGANTAAVFTRNAFCAAPVTVAKRHLGMGAIRYLLINSGNANAGTGEPGLMAAEASCIALANQTGDNAREVLPFSTGVIGEPLPVEKIEKVLPQAIDALQLDGWADAARAIMTTDTVPKGVSVTFISQGSEITITGIAKGSGMIRPDMATMLSYVATDAGVQQTDLQSCLGEAVNRSFNRITVDGDTSTNDACVLIATGKSGVNLKPGTADYKVFCNAVTQVCEHLAQAIIRDGEGATKLITIDVVEGQDQKECERVAFTVAHSPLVKTAFFASDPNWGRILAAVGRAGIENLDISKIYIYLGNLCIVENGGRAPSYTEAAGQAEMAQTDITVKICLGRGDSQARVWTCDFSYEYVRINAEYRT